MRKPIVKNLYEYEIIKNQGEGLKGYGWNVVVYKNGEKVYEHGAFGAESIAEVNARDYFLLEEFGIDRDDATDTSAGMQDKMNRKAIINTPNLDYSFLKKVVRK